MRRARPRKPALLAALTLALLAAAAQAQDNACQSDGATRIGILEASLTGTMTSSSRGNDLVIGIPERTEANRWSLTRSGDPADNTPTPYPVLDTSTNAIVVPARAAALVWLEILPPASSPDSSTQPTKIRLMTDLPQGHYEAAALAVSANHYREGSEELQEVIFCVDNTQTEQTTTWSFGLLIDGVWYDPQIKNIGSGPPPP